MTPEELNDMKRLHNKIMEEGQAAYKKVMECYEKMMPLRKQIEAIEGEDYDGLPLIFGDGYWIDEDSK